MQLKQSRLHTAAIFFYLKYYLSSLLACLFAAAASLSAHLAVIMLMFDALFAAGTACSGAKVEHIYCHCGIT
jgi:hypothetical protein